MSHALGQQIRPRYHTIVTLDQYYWPESVVLGTGDQVAYATQTANGVSVITGRAINGQFQDAGGIVFDPSGPSRTAFLVRSDTGYYAAVAGRLLGPTQEPPDIEFSPDGQHFICVDRVKQYVYVVDRSLRVQRFKYMGYKLGSKGHGSAFVISNGSKQAVLVNGALGPLFDGIYPASEGSESDLYSDWDFVFDEAGEHFAYVARKEGRACVVKDNEIIGQCHERVSQGSLQIAPGGDHVTYIAGAGKKQFVIFGDKKEPSFDQIWLIFLSPDWSSRIYSGRLGKEWTVMVNGIAKGSYQGTVLKVAFSPNGGRLAFTTARGEKRICVSDSRTGPGYDDISSLRFSENGAHLAYIATNQGKESIVLDGRVLSIPVNSFSDLLFSPDGSRLAVVAHEENGDRVFVDGAPGGRYARVVTDSLAFSDDGKTVAYITEDSDKKQYVVKDNRVYGSYREVLKQGPHKYIFFFPQTSDAIYSVANRENTLVILDGRPLFQLRCVIQHPSISDPSFIGCLSNTVAKITLKKAQDE